MDKEKRRKLMKLGLPIILGTILLIGISYAFLMLTLSGTKTNSIKGATLSLLLNDEETIGTGLDKAVPMLDNVGLTKDPYTFKLENNGTIPSEYTIYLDDTDLETGEGRLPDNFIKYNLTRDGETLDTKLLSLTGTNPNRILDSGVINKGDTYTYDLRMWLDSSITDPDDIVNKTFRGKIRVVATQVIESPYNNNNIVSVYKYEPTNTETLCITGEEETCELITPDTYEAGTIVEYKVNANETKFFYVLHDDGDKLTMQQRENTLEDVQWYSSGSNAYGPTVALAALETETSDWNNVLDQTYTMGTTLFGNADNAFTGCSAYNKCETNTYTLAERTGKARMITLQEAAVGCTGTSESCPIWMYNYLNGSKSYGGTANAGSESYYRTMTAYSSSTYSAWCVDYSGRVYYNYNVSLAYAVRAVVQISK